MRHLILIITISTSACSYTPVADLRASGDAAHFYQRDVNECRQLIKEARSIWHKPLDRTRPVAGQVSCRSRP